MRKPGPRQAIEPFLKKFYPSDVSAVKLLFDYAERTRGKALQASIVACLVLSVARMATKKETIRFQRWNDGRWCLTVEDKSCLKKGGPISDMVRLCFTVDPIKKKVQWSDEGGNCYVRGRRWKLWLDMAFPRANEAACRIYE